MNLLCHLITTPSSPPKIGGELDELLSYPLQMRKNHIFAYLKDADYRKKLLYI